MESQIVVAPRSSQAWHDGKIVIVMLWRWLPAVYDRHLDWPEREEFLIHPWQVEGPAKWVPVEEVTFR